MMVVVFIPPALRSAAVPRGDGMAVVDFSDASAGKGFARTLLFEL